MRTFACVVCAFFGALAVYVWLYEHFVVMNDSDTMIQTTNTLATLLPVDADRSRIIQTAHAGGHTFKSPFDIIEPKNIADIDTITLDYKYGSTQGKKNSVKVRGSTVYLAWEMSFRAFVKNATAFFQNKLEGIKATLSRNAQSCNAGILAHLSDIDASQNLALISEMVMWCFRPTQRMIETGKRPSESPERTTQTETDQLTRMIDRLQVDPADRQYERGMTKESIKAGLKTTLLQLRNSYYSTMVDLGVIIESYSIYDLDLPVTRQKIQTNRASIADVKYQTAELLGLTSTKHEGGWEYEWYIMSTDPEKAGILQERLILVAQMLGVENLFTINSKGGKGGSPFVMPGMHQPSNSDKNPSEDPDDVN
ncbi:MAG TPA: hypothetical protein PLF31_00900 [Candidatus Paceibacterota bacterium]|nr:hypothetical protein [Candidatus Paceibacterota bacterium]